MKRREFIAGLGAAAWPLAARGQQVRAMRRVGVLLRLAEGDPETNAVLAGFRQGLERRGWLEGQNLHIDYRLGVTLDHQIVATAARELLSLRPDVIFAQGPFLVAALKHESRAAPIVLVQISDPIGSGFIANLARPGGNITGLALLEAPVAGKWFQMLREIAPSISRIALIVATGNSFANYLPEIETMASSLGIKLIFTAVEDTEADIGQAIESFAREPNGGLVLPPDFVLTAHRQLIIALAARHRLPAIYSDKVFVKDGGLL
jgi:putative tryptophan/tyrosine transport system substrate-binding protein